MTSKLSTRQILRKSLLTIAPVKLSGDRMDVRVRETNLGNVVADALLDYGQSAFTHKV